MLNQSVFQTLSDEVKDTFKFRYVIHSFVSTTLRQRYRRSILGFSWSLLSPILNYGVMAVVFSRGMGGGIPNYFAYFFSGAIIFNLLSAVINQSPGVLIGNENYIKKIYIPKLVFVLNSVCTELINFVLGFLALVLFSMFFGKLTFSVTWLSIPYIILVTTVFALGLSSIISICAVYFRDMLHIIPILMQIAFFMTPILYEAKSFSPAFQFITKINPFFYFVEVLRYPLYRNTWPSVRHLEFTTFLALATAGLGLYLLKKFDNKIVFKL